MYLLCSCLSPSHQAAPRAHHVICFVRTVLLVLLAVVVVVVAVVVVAVVVAVVVVLLGGIVNRTKYC